MTRKYVDRFSDKEMENLEKFARNFRSAAYMVVKRLIDSHLQSFAYETYTDEDYQEWKKDLDALIRCFKIARQIIE